MKKCRPPDELRGTPEFKEFYNGLSKNCETYKRIKYCLDILQENMLAGDKIEKEKYPKLYVKKYGIQNLFRMETSKECRLTYTIIAKDSKKIVFVLEYFKNHKDYDRRFGYS